MIDLHCHVLPGIDDGPVTMAETVELCRLAHARGTRTIVATPHVSWDHPDNDAARIAEACEEVRAALRTEGVDLELVPGAEVAFTRAAELDDAELAALRLGGGPWLLVEPPFSPAALGFDAVLDELRRRGHRLVIAHPERIAAFHHDRERLERYVAEGMLTSVTAGSFGGRFGRVVQRFAMDLLRDGLVHDVASDAHGPALNRPPGLAQELTDQGWGSHVEHLCHAVPRAILAGEALPTAPPPPPARTRRGLLGRLRRAS